MAKYARGKKSQAISDRSGLRVPYTQLKTTWDGLRVSPEDWEPKNPQLTPAKNVVDATALFNPRPDNDPENVEIFIGFNYDPFIDPRKRPVSYTDRRAHETKAIIVCRLLLEKKKKKKLGRITFAVLYFTNHTKLNRISTAMIFIK